MQQERGLSRRTYLSGLGSAATVGLAGCLGGGGGGSLDEITVAYMPIYPDMQYFVMDQEGYFADVDATVSGKQFTDGPSIVQAYASGEIDVAMFGVVPAMIVIDKGIQAKVTAANIKEAMLLLAHDDFVPTWEQQGADAFATWKQETGRPFRFGTFPEGSVPDIVLRYWLREDQGLTPGEDVEIVGLGGANAVRQGLSTGEVDGACIMEPVPTVVQRSDEPYGVLTAAPDFFPGQPAAVVLMNDAVRNADVGQQFIEQHVAATRFINDNPRTAARHASTVVGEQSLSVPVARDAMDSAGSNFVSAPNEIESGVEVFTSYAHDLGKTDESLGLDQVFDRSLYESATQ
ncbi:ABC transporter substrate-binding protein [Halobacteriales archaeon Cl-PHB]